MCTDQDSTYILEHFDQCSTISMDAKRSNWDTAFPVRVQRKVLI